MSDKTTKSMILMFLSVEGRLNRLRYFKRGLVIGVVAVLLDVLFSNGDGSDNGFTIAFGILFLLPTYCLNVRRLKDLDKDATVAVLYLILETILLIFEMFGWDSMSMASLERGIITGYAQIYICTLVVQLAISIFLTFVPGTQGENKYGKDPLGMSEIIETDFFERRVVVNVESSEEPQTDAQISESKNSVTWAGPLAVGVCMFLRNHRYDWWEALLIGLAVVFVAVIVHGLYSEDKKF